MNNSPASILFDSDGNAVSIVDDDGEYRVSVSGKFTQDVLPLPPSSVPVTIVADDPLSIHGSDDSEYIISNTKVFYIQQMVAGAGGDPTENGSKVEVIYYDGVSEHVLERFYISGFTQHIIYPDISRARDNSLMEGDGSAKKIIIRRIRLSGVSQEVDCVVRGYEL